MTPDLLAPYLSLHHRAWLARGGSRHQCLDGTLLFLDISGFTPLTERLAGRGKIGSEELTDHLNAVFALLLEAAARLGGDVLKFGGDALLLLFTGEDHAVRGQAAAWDMQQAMRPFARLRTSAGVLPLRASSAVASGPVHLFLAGDAYDDQIVAGPTLTECLRLEAAAAAGEVLVAGGARLRRRPEVPAVAPPAPAPVDSRRGLPAQLHDELGRGETGEHRRAVVAFVQVRRLDELLEEAGPAVVAAELDHLLADVQRACDRHDVTFLTTDADQGAIKVMLVAGAPRAHPDDADRMLRAVGEVVRSPRRLVTRAGVNRGRVFALDIGTPTRRTYSAMGDATNLAARVMGKAPDGGVLATQATLDGLRGRFALEPVPAFAVKGKTAPVEAALVGEPAGTAAAGRDADPTVPPGREAEAEAIRHALAAPGVLQLEGEAGIGKSRLVDFALATARASELEVLLLEGGAYGAYAAFLPLRVPLRRRLGLDAGASAAAVQAALRAVAARHVTEADDWLPLLASLIGLDLPPTPRMARLDPDALRRRRHIAAGELLRGLLPPGSLVVIEDGHWLDEASSDLLAAVLAQPGAQDWAVLAVRRPGEEGLRLGETERAVTRTVGPLGGQAARSLVLGAAEAGGIPPDAVAAIVRRADGNPLMLRELVAAVRAGGDLDALPDDVEELLADRVDRLPVDDRTALREMAVLGARFDVPTAARLLGREPAAMGPLFERLDGFVTDEGPRVVFRHALLRSAAYEGLSYRRRRDLHGRALDVLVAGAKEDLAPLVELLALHAHHAGRDEGCWTWARDGARRALERGAPSDALTLFAWAAAAGRRLPEVDAAALAALDEARGDAAEQAGRYEAAFAAYAAARRGRTGDPLAWARLCRKTARMAERLGRYRDALAWSTRGRRRLEAVPAGAERDAVGGHLAVVAGMARLRQGRAREAVALLDGAIATLRDTRDEGALAHALYVAGHAHADVGESGLAMALEREALDRYERVGDLAGAASAINNLGIDAYFLGDWETAADCYRRSAALRHELGDAVLAAEAEMNLGELLADQGRFAAAEPLFRDALTIFRSASIAGHIGLVTSDLGRLAARRGDTDAALGLLAEARAVFGGIGADVLRAEAGVREAEALALGGRAAEALERAATLDTELAAVDAGRLYVAMLERIRGWARAQLGDRRTAAAHLEAALRHAREQESPYDEVAALDALERLEGGDDRRQGIADLLARLGIDALPVPPGLA